MNAPLEFLMHDHPRTVRERRQARGKWRAIHPPTLLRTYAEPEIAIAAAVIQLTAADIRSNNHRDECFAFLHSEWFLLIARGLDFHPDTLHTLETSK